MTPYLDLRPICGRELGYCPCAPLVLIGCALFGLPVHLALIGALALIEQALEATW